MGNNRPGKWKSGMGLWMGSAIMVSVAMPVAHADTPSPAQAPTGSADVQRTGMAFPAFEPLSGAGAADRLTPEMLQGRFTVMNLWYEY